MIQSGDKCVCGADGYTLIDGICTHVGFQNDKNNKMTKIDNIGNKDYLQLLAYMFRFDAKAGYYLYPETEIP